MNSSMTPIGVWTGCRCRSGQNSSYPKRRLKETHWWPKRSDYHSKTIERWTRRTQTRGRTLCGIRPIPYAFRKTDSLHSKQAETLDGVDSAGLCGCPNIMRYPFLSLGHQMEFMSPLDHHRLLVFLGCGYIVQRVNEIVMSVPVLIVLLVLIAFIEKPSNLPIMELGLLWTVGARSGSFIDWESGLCDQCRCLGYKPTRIIFQHILPNALGPVLVAATFGVAGAILTESGLSFWALEMWVFRLGTNPRMDTTAALGTWFCPICHFATIPNPQPRWGRSSRCPWSEDEKVRRRYDQTTFRTDQSRTYFHTDIGS